jgi:hypothetical protein
MRKLFYVFIFSFVLLAPTTIYAQETSAEPAAATAPAEAESVAERTSAPPPKEEEASAGFFESNIEAILSIIGSILALIVGLERFSKYKETLDKINDNKGWQIAKGAITEVYHEFVRDLKKGREDSKLTAAEAKAARERAIAKIKTRAKAEGVKIVLGALPGLIEAALNAVKKDAKSAKAT